MPTYFLNNSRTWKEIYPGVLVADLHRYASGGGAGVFMLKPGAILPEHGHPTGEHGYVIEGTGTFGPKSLSAGDAFWINSDERHEIRAETKLVFFATSLPMPEA